MSLLLDALKKAADEKNKHDSIKNDTPSSNIDAPSTPHSNKNDTQPESEKNTEDESLELELNIEAENNTLKSSPETDDFPTVNDNIMPSADKNIGPQVSKEQPLEIKPADKEIEKTDSVDKPSENTKEELKEAKPIIEPVLEAVKVEPNPPTVAKTEKKQSVDRPSTQASKIENEQALSALINKSNQYSRSEKLKRNITLAILITLVISGAALYFFIQMKASTQDLYIAQNHNETIKRPVQTAIQTPSAPHKTTQAAVAIPIRTESKAIARTPRPIVKAYKPAKQTSTSTKKITIIHTKKADPVHVLLRDAYRAFHDADYKKSDTLYTKVLQREARNRDALLGIAAIAIKQQRYEYARQKYLYLLKLNPRDSLATAGISNLESNVNSHLNESHLKFMLRQQPDAAHLYFALGGLYLQQEEWAQAQSAYFSAWSAENKNPDYAYNLAISLDHLDKKKQALEFYQLSLKLKRASNNGNFSVKTTEQRIASLQAAKS